MQSSSETAGRRGWRAYAFRQLDAPPAGTSNGIADVLSAVRAEAEQIRAQAWAAGEAEGRAAGLAAARTEAAPAVARDRAPRSGRSPSCATQVVAELEQDAVEMAMQLAEQILAGVISVEPERVIDVGRNALRHLSDRRRVTVVVNPEDLELVSECVEQLQSELGGIEHLGVQSDRRIGRGGAIARTDSGEIDSGLDAQLGRAREIVAAALAREPSDRCLASPALPDALQGADLSRRVGRVSDLIGLIIEATGVQVEIGEVCMVGDGRDRAVGGRRGRRLPRRAHAADAARRAPRDRPGHERSPDRRAVPGGGRRAAARARDRRPGQSSGRGRRAVGRVVARHDRRAARSADAPADQPTASALGVRALDTLVPCGRGQRLGIFAGSGVGKSSLLGMIARSTAARST